MVIAGALGPASKTTYGAGVMCFTQFCNEWKIPEEDRMPASYTLLCAFIGSWKGIHSGITIRLWLSGIRGWHITNHAPWCGDDELLKLARISANKEGSKHKGPLHAPVSIEHLCAIQRAIDLSTPFHAAVWAVALVTFFGCRRLGETIVSVANAFDPKYHVLNSTIISFRVLRDGTCTASFCIPWTKTTKEEGASVILTGRRDHLCPVSALQNHISVNAPSPSEPAAALFAYKTESGALQNMTKFVFMSFVNSIWSTAMLAHVLGHSFRIGGAVELLLAGVPPEIVVATGGWTSLAFLLYWRRMDEILPMSTSKAYNKTHIDRLAIIFDEFCDRSRIPKNFYTASDGTISLDDN